MSEGKELQLAADERIDDLLTNSGLRIIQSREVFSFSLDAVLLSRFATIPKKGRIADLCTGNGVIPLLLSERTDAHIDAIEIQPRLADMARRSVAMNGREHRIAVIEADLRQYYKEAGNGLYDAITVNPPYMPVTAGDKNENEHYAIARHEIHCTIEDIARACCRILRTGGKLSLVHRPSRLLDILESLRRWRLEPKRIQFIHPHAGAEANMVLIEASRDGKPDIKLLPPIMVYDDEGVQIV
ncbi:tRNA1(Val) (adenine(37)-N6)-methyltransferase [Paenibacillus sp. J5C_2022]|uniref:tRNA1(Val) (adenine(37)-N6)-methyltransferase n=1 Tax=Paenibacillus sp. J5C2022 TaxID=2977129 RepID=UPI0021CFB5D1|nr:tRNA1(Val) (adenine(37)-N6)-methyltransferase [Paenibacillus sp. J5C2022]MCU6710871.1 tRNA1(Val) (adenine(37)-N6)-methyltransferase [Paenibacillus sp. J5C2022]